MAGMPEVGRFYPSAEGCTGLTWQHLVDQLSGINPAISKIMGKIVVNIGIGSGQHKAPATRTTNYDLMVLDILKEAGSLTTPEIFDETFFLGTPVPLESLLKVCRKLEKNGLLLSSKRTYAGRRVNVWTLIKTK